LCDVKVLGSQSELGNEDGISFALAMINGKMIPCKVCVHGANSGLGDDEISPHNGRQKESLLHSRVICRNVSKAFSLECKGFIVITILYVVGDPPQEIDCLSGATTTGLPREHLYGSSHTLF
jgi:hypothetical protein